jgi:hypothetical protein
LERNHQIKLMTKIYSKAKRVLVWLGPDPYGLGEEAFDDFRRLAMSKSFASLFSDDRDHPNDWDESPRRVKPFEHMHSHEWFHRIWTMQEIGLASCATFMCGSSQIDWTNLLIAYNLYDQKYQP